MSRDCTGEKPERNEATGQVLSMSERRGRQQTASHFITLSSARAPAAGSGADRRPEQFTGDQPRPLIPFSHSSDTATPPTAFPTIHFRLPFYDFTTQFFLEFYGISLKPPEGDTAPFLGVK